MKVVATRKTVYHEENSDGVFKHLEQTDTIAVEILEMSQRMKDSVDKYVARQADMSMAEMAATVAIPEHSPRIDNVSDKQLRDLRDDLARLYSCGTENGDEHIVNVLQLRQRYVHKHVPSLRPLFKQFADITIRAYDSYKNDHFAKKKEMLYDNFAPWIQKMVDERKVNQYNLMYATKTQMMSQAWSIAGGREGGEGYAAYFKRGMHDWVKPDEFETVVDTLYSKTCICFRSKENISAFPLSFGFSPQQIVHFYPTYGLEDYTYPIIHKAMMDFEHGDYEAIEKCRSTVNMMKQEKVNYISGVKCVLSYSPALPQVFICVAAPPVVSLRHWFKVHILVTGEELWLPGNRLCIADFSSTMHSLVKEHVRIDVFQKELHGPTISLLSASDNKLLQSFPMNLAKYAPEFQWVMRADEAKQLKLYNELRYQEEEEKEKEEITSSAVEELPEQPLTPG